jgi:hypothetical protein
MYEITGALATLAGIIILYRSRQSLHRQRDILLRELGTVAVLNKQLTQIVSVHGCAPRKLVDEGTTHRCGDCGTTWEARDFEVSWLDDGLKNQIHQSWELTSQE